MDIRLQIEQRDDWEHIYYIGPINEDAEVHLGDLLGKIGDKCIFNFKQVEYVNSCGVRAWINFLREAEKGRKIQFRECTPEIVSQINMIPNFKGNAHIESVYASYSCDECGNSKWELFSEGQNLPKSAEEEVPDVKCEKCGELMEMEELEDEFFSWLEAG